MTKNLEKNNKTKEELKGLLKETRANLMKLKFDLNENRLKDVSRIKKTKKEIARLLTSLNNQK